VFSKTNDHFAIRARAKEGRHYTMCALFGKLTFKGMRVDKLGSHKRETFCNDTGEGYPGPIERAMFRMFLNNA